MASGIISVILYAILFYQIKLYGDCIEQFYYLGASVYGWWFWIKHRNKSDEDLINIRFSNKLFIYISIIATLIISIILDFFISKVHLFLPLIFTEKASFPFVDALTTIMSFTAMFLLAQKRIESWIYWIIVDIIGIVLYFIKDVKFISLLYIILLILATKGLISWIKTYNKYNLKNK